MKNISNTTGRTAFAVSAKQTKTSTTCRKPSFKWGRINGVATKVSPAEYERIMSATNQAQLLRASLTKHEPVLKDFGSLFSDLAEYMQCVELFQSGYGERLEEHGLGGFSNAELSEVLASIQEFQGYSTYWAKALKPFVKIAS